MKTISLLALTALALPFLGGCSTSNSSCGCLPANCCSWDFYKKCDLIEGKTSACRDLCGQVDCKPGVVVSRCYAVPVQQAAPPTKVQEASPEATPAPAEAAEGAAGGEPVADFGLPPAGR